MSQRISRWCTRASLGTALMAGVVFVAWCVSYVTDSGMPFVKPGRICVLVNTNPDEGDGFPPQSNWVITGIFTDALMTVAPDRVSAEIRATAAPVLTETPAEIVQNPPRRVPLHEILSEIHYPDQVTGFQVQDFTDSDPVGDAFILTAASDQPAAPARLPEMAAPSLLATAVAAVQEPFDEGDGAPVTRSRWEWGGFLVEELVSADVGAGTIVQIPHWMPFLLLVLISTTLLTAPRWTRRKRHPAVAAVSNAVAVEPVAVSKGWTIWGRRTGMVALVALCILTAGWVRSWTVSDVVTFYGWPSLRLLSGKEGLVLERYQPIGESGSVRVRYRQLTGREHHVESCRPLGIDFQFQEEDFELSPAGTLLDGTLLTAMVPASLEIPATVTGEPVAPSRQGISFTSADPENWVGRNFDWAGLYFSSGSTGTTLAVPYGFLLVPVLLMAATGIFSPANLRQGWRLIPKRSSVLKS